MENNYITARDYKPCVFQVPDDLRETKPNAYIPQMVGLGPYHHFRPEVQLIGSKKRAATEDCLKENKVEAEFIDLVRNRAPELEHKIRSYYDRYLDLEKETLAWVLIVDGIYLVRFIDDYLKYPEEKKHKVHPNVGSLVEDVFKLENQIPYRLLIELAGIIAPNTVLSVMNKFFINFFSFCNEHMPLCFGGDPHKFFYYQDQCDHLLHFVYELIVNNKRENYVDHGKSEEKEEYDHGKSEEEGRGYRDWLRSRLAEFADFGSEILGQAIHEFNSALTYGTNAGLKIPGNVEKVSQILNHVEKTLQSFHKKEAFSGDKIEIPSASRLFAIRRIKFKALPPDCGIGNISLDKDKKIFYLPVIWMEESSEVILRNLVAYEATKIEGERRKMLSC